MQPGVDIMRLQARRHRVGYRAGFTQGVILLAFLFLGSLGFVLLLLFSGGQDRFNASGNRDDFHPSGKDEGSGKVLLLGEYQKMMLEMLDGSLPFTVFVPSMAAMSRVLNSTIEALERDRKAESGATFDVNATQGTGRADIMPEVSISGVSKSSHSSQLLLSGNKSFTVAAEELDAISAVVSRLLAFAAIPTRILAAGMALSSESSWESISGYIVYVAKDPTRGLLANNMTCLATDIFRGSTVIHILDGALMDPEFEQAVIIEDEDT